jgi:hypothetical protein
MRLIRTRHRINELELWLADEHDYVANMHTAVLDIETTLQNAKQSLHETMQEPIFTHWVRGFDLDTTDEGIKTHSCIRETSFADGFVRRTIMAVMMHVQLWQMCIELNPTGWPRNYIAMTTDCVGSVPWPALREARLFAAVPGVQDNVVTQRAMTLINEHAPVLDETLRAIFEFVDTVTDLRECREVARTKLADEKLAIQHAHTQMHCYMATIQMTEDFLQVQQRRVQTQDTPLTLGRLRRFFRFRQAPDASAWKPLVNRFTQRP